MGRYITISQEVDVDIDMEDFATDELIAELQRRQTGISQSYDATQLLAIIFEKRRLGKDYQTELDELIYQNLGRII